MYWFISQDTLGFQIEIKEQPLTRRGILSIVSSIFDLLGIAAPFVLVAKSLLQRLCKTDTGWDEPISEENVKDWRKWLAQVKELEHITIDRCYKPKDLEI